MQNTNYKVIKPDGSSNGVFATKAEAEAWADAIRTPGWARPKVVKTSKPVNAKTE